VSVVCVGCVFWRGRVCCMCMVCARRCNFCEYFRVCVSLCMCLYPRETHRETPREGHTETHKATHRDTEVYGERYMERNK